MSTRSHLDLDLQYAWTTPNLPEETRVRACLEAALSGRPRACEVTVRIVGEAESCRLNRDFRAVDRPTNVLSFPFESPPGLDETAVFLGDLVVCAPVVEAEADDQGMPCEARYAHMIVHGALHLVGYDHGTDDEALEMETLETEILQRLGYPDPYCVADES